MDYIRKKNLVLSLILSIPLSLFFAIYCTAEEIIINSENIEYKEETQTYTARGNVRMQRFDTNLESDEVIYNEQTSELFATGDIRYDSPYVSITAEKAQLHIKAETGILYDAQILLKEDNYHIAGERIEKRGERYFFSPKATFTTCDAPVPAWCFKGKQIDAKAGERLTAKDVSFYIKDVPILYTPYLRTPLLTDRQTGFLMPDIGYSKTRGLNVSLPFFWALSENRDATFTLDIHTKRGIGERLEYRYREHKNIKGNCLLTHLNDTELSKNYFEVRATHEQRSREEIGGFLNINFINEKEFYREFSPQVEVRTNRFLESTGELSIPFTNARMYLLSQYWIDLKEESTPVPHKIPELGYTLNTIRFNNLWYSGAISLTNFLRDENVYGQRFDIYPRLSHTFGANMMISQNLGLRETAYFLDRSVDDFLHREAIIYNIKTHTRLIRAYQHITHVIEPTLEYSLISSSESPPLFDSAELLKNTSQIKLSFLNRLISRNGEFMVLKASQGFDLRDEDRPFLPFQLEIGIKRPVLFRLEATYDFDKGELNSINSDLWFNVFGTTVLAGQRYNRQSDITFYSAGINFNPLKSLNMEGRLWYDAQEDKLKDVTINVRYVRQCWAVNMQVVKKPGDFVVGIMFELKGLGSQRLGA